MYRNCCERYTIFGPMADIFCFYSKMQRDCDAIAIVMVVLCRRSGDSWIAVRSTGRWFALFCRLGAVRT